MIEAIRTELNRIEDEHEVRILLAVESGSRAWGFASTDSDWDVRYIYVHKVDWYLKIDALKDSQEEILPNDIDLSGWELKKALRLFRKSNPPLLEWLCSPIIYREMHSTAARMRELSKRFFSPKSCMHHYLSMARNNFREFLANRDVVRAKKYFYVLRPVLACDWIRRTNTPPPIEFAKLVGAEVDDRTVRSEIEGLLERKIAGEELKEGPANSVLNEFLTGRIRFFEEFVESIEPGQIAETALLDDLFRESLNEAWSMDS